MLHAKEIYGGLGLVDLEASKTNLLYKWVIKAMEPCESNLQLMLYVQTNTLQPTKKEMLGGWA